MERRKFSSIAESTYLMRFLGAALQQTCQEMARYAEQSVESSLYIQFGCPEVGTVLCVWEVASTVKILSGNQRVHKVSS